MDLKTSLLEAPTPEWHQRHTQYVLEDKKRFHDLMRYILATPDGNYRLNQRATLILLDVERHQPIWIEEQIGAMCDHLHRDLPVALKRNLLRVLQNHQIPESRWGKVADECFYFLGSHDEPIAVKVFAMSVLHGLTRHIPELAPELRYLIEEQFPYGSAGFKSRGRKVLAALTKAGY